MVIQSGLSLPKITLGLGVWKTGRSRETRFGAEGVGRVIGFCIL